MRWEDERYVRVYVRDTADWLALGWEAQSLLVLTMRKVDRAGLLELGRAGVRGLAAVVGMPLEVVDRALRVLLEDGCVVLNGSTLVIPNFIEAQEAAQSDAQRKRESRARARDIAAASGPLPSRNVPAAGRNVTTAPEPVTPSHVASQSVTPSCAVPSRAEPFEETPPPAGARARDEGHDLDPEAAQYSPAARHETASGPTPHPVETAEKPREPADAPVFPGPRAAAGDESPGPGDAPAESDPAKANAGSGDGAAPQRPDGGEAPGAADRRDTASGGRGAPARRDLRADDYPETAKLLAELSAAGFEAAYPRDAVAAGAVERAVVLVGIAAARDRVMAVVEGDRALRVESRPWLGWYLDAIQGQQPRGRAARAAATTGTDIRLGAAAPGHFDAKGGDVELTR